MTATTSTPVVPRLRHLVHMSDDLARTGRLLETELGLTDPFQDPIAGEFGLRNHIYGLGDCFLEVCQPVDPASAGQRFLDRNGPGGYMVIVQVPDATAARERLGALGMRVIWEGSRPGIRGLHIHPADLPGAIVSFDEAEPAGSWAWGGPAWAGRIGPTGPHLLRSVTMAVPDRDTARSTWAAALPDARPDPDRGGLLIGDGRIEFTRSGGRPGLARVGLSVPAYVSRGRDSLEIDGLHIDFERNGAA